MPSCGVIGAIRMIDRVAALWLSLLALPALAQPVPAAPAVPPAATAPADRSEAGFDEQLVLADRLIREGKPQDAIDRHLDPILAHYETKWPASGKRVYSARGAAVTLLYLLMAAKDKVAAVALDDKWANAVYMKAFALVDLGRLADAEALYRRGLALSPLDARFLCEIGNLQQQRRDWAAALATFTEAESAADVSPEEIRTKELTRALRGQGFALIEMQRLDEAEARYRRCLQLDAGDRKAKQELDYIRQQRQGAGAPPPVT